MPATYPSRTDYETVIRRLDLFAADSTIKSGRVLMRKDGLFPQAYSGGRAVVFPITIRNKKYALKCWIQHLGALEERYQAITRLLEKTRIPYLVPSVYRQNELLFNGTRYPVLQMEWSDSVTLKEWITANVNAPMKLLDVADKFIGIVSDMHKIGMSHGDLQHENILVGAKLDVTLVDYDSIYLPGLDHLQDEVKGLPGFQHHSRSQQVKANSKSDYLSEYVIYTTLVALSKRPELWTDARDHNRLLFSQDDIYKPESSALFAELKTIDTLSELVEAFQLQCQCSSLNDIVPIESLIGSQTFSPSVKTQNKKPSRVQAPTTTNSSQRGTVTALRKAKTWEGSQNKSSTWIFKGVDDSSEDFKGFAATGSGSQESGSSSGCQDQKPSSKSEEAPYSSANTTRNGSTGGKESSTGVANQSKWPCVVTPDHVIEGYLSSQQILTRTLISMTFMSIHVKLECISKTGVKSELLIPKERFVGWRGIGTKLELVTSNMYGGTDVLTISAPRLTATGSISRLINQLKDAGIDVAWPSKDSDGTTNQRSVSEGSNNKDYNKSFNASSHKSPGSSGWAFSSKPKFSYASVDDIAYCIGVPVSMVEDLVKQFQIRPPFSLGEANRIAGELAGEPSIRKVFDRRHASRDSSRRGSYGSKPNSNSSHANDMENSGTPPNGFPWIATPRYRQPAGDRQFAYSSIDDIAYCTGKPVGLVQEAVNSLRVKPPFTLIEADRIAACLLGDPSIRRAYDKTVSLQSTGPKDSVVANEHSVSTAAQKSTEANVVAPSVTSPVNANSSNKTDSNRHSAVAKQVSDSKSDCFVATAIYGTSSHPDLSILRAYRDSVLMSSRLGRRFVSWYYKVGPSIARVVVNAKLAPSLRPLLSMIVHRISIKK
jgi:hypothetical protein